MEQSEEFPQTGRTVSHHEAERPSAAGRSLHGQQGAASPSVPFHITPIIITSWEVGLSDATKLQQVLPSPVIQTVFGYTDDFPSF